MTPDELDAIMEQVDELRRQVISQFAGISIDMDYVLCIPSVHARYEDKNLVVDFEGNIRQDDDGFPQDKKEMVVKWVKLHEKEILENHHRVNNTREPLLMIRPLDS